MGPVDIALIVGAFVLILAGAEVFTNGVEWLGLKLRISEGATGSILAAIGTATPETLIPVVAILFTNTALAHRTGSELYVLEVARALLARGHQPLAWSPVLGDLAAIRFDVGEGFMPVDVRLALAEQVQIGTVQDVDKAAHGFLRVSAVGRGRA